MLVITYKKMTDSVKAQIKDALSVVNKRARKLSVSECVKVNKACKAGSFAYDNGGDVPSSYRYPATTTFCAVVSLGKEGRVMIIGDQDAYNPTISRAIRGKILGQGSSPDIRELQDIARFQKAKVEA